MKGTIHKCLGEMVVAQYGEEKWRAYLKAGGFSLGHVFYATEAIDEKLFYIGLARVGKYFQEDLVIHTLSERRLDIIFPN